MVIYLGSLVQLCCGEGGTLQANITGMCGEYSQCLGHTGFAPALGMCAFLVYTTEAPGCSAGELSKAGPGLCALPRSKPLRFRFLGTPQKHRLVGPAFCALPRSEQLRQPGAWRVYSPQVGRCILSPPWSWPLSFPVLSGSTVSGVPCVSSGELISGCDPPGGCQPSRIPGRLGEQLGACSQFDRGCCLWGRICPFPSVSGWHLPASLPLAGMGQSTAG